MTKDEAYALADRLTTTPWDTGLQDAADALRQFADDNELLNKYVLGLESAASRQAERIGALEAELAALRQFDSIAEQADEALQLTLLFHRGGFWGDAERAKWKLITGKDESTTKVLCDHIRAALARSKYRRT